MGAIGLGIGGSTSRRVLRWCEVTDALCGLVHDRLVREILLLGFRNCVMRRHGVIQKEDRGRFGRVKRNLGGFKKSYSSGGGSYSALLIRTLLRDYECLQMINVR